MLTRSTRRTLAVLVGFATSAAQAQGTTAKAIPLDRNTKMQVVNGRIKWADYRGRPALNLAPLEGHEHDIDQEMFAVITDNDFQDGVIEVDPSGARREGYPADNASAHKGHVGISFRIRGDTAERLY